ncbi:MAG: ABC transporter ATP-binding protein [Spirochaetales bacterium]|nr:ABC transporter ATP-binding protein [Spirochaetales bacterium]
MSALTLENFSCGYSSTPVVTHIDMCIPSSRLTVLLGPNGSGKTSLLRGITRILKPLSGTVELDNQNIYNIPLKQFSRRLARVSQSIEVNWPYTVHDFVAMGRYPHRRFFSKLDSHSAEIVDATLKETGLSAFAHRSITRISGGEFQRAKIARALAGEPEVLVLDEPIAHLDLHYQVSIMNELQRICKSGKTVFVSLHDLNFAARYADYVYLLSEGQIAAHGTPDQVIAPDTLSAVFKTPISVHTLEGHIFTMPANP